MLPLMLAAVLSVAPSTQPPACESDCDERGCWLLVYRYHFTNDKGRSQVFEMFDGRRAPTEEAAYCQAAELRKTGVLLPTLGRYGRDSNVMPDAITPMPHLGATEMGIPPAHPWQAGERPEEPR